MAGASHEAGSSAGKPVDDPESTIEINIKTLDSRVHKLRVHKNAPVSAVKEKIVEATGVPWDQQRLIFRGRVLKDDQLLSEYHLEDGFTLHLVARRAAGGQPSSGSSEGNNHANVNDAGNGALLDDISRSVQNLLGSLGVAMSGGVTSTSFSVPLGPAPEGANNAPGGTQPVNPAHPGFPAQQIHLAQLQPGGGGAIPRNMSVQNLLSSLGVAMPSGVTSASFSVPLGPEPEGANNAPGGTQPVNPAHPGFSAQQIHVAQLQPGGAIPRNMVIPDSMTTLSEYMERMDQVLQNNGTPLSRDSEGQQHPVADDANVNPTFPSPEVLAQVIDRTQQLLGGSAASALSHIAQRIRSDASTVDASARREIQTESVQLGMSMQHMGAMLFELGRTMMMLRMGQSPSEGFVNAGPAVYINSTGPNPIMVQPSFQSTHPFGVSNIPIMGGVSGAFGIFNPSRSTGAPAASAPSVATATPSEGAVNRDGQDAARTQGGNPSNNSAATRGLPARTVVAAIPARSSVEVPNHVLSLLVPAQVRSQVAMPNQSASPQGSQNTMGNGSGQHSTSAVPQASVGGVAGIPSTVAQVNQHVANALVASTPVQVPPSAQNTAEHGSHLTIDSRASDLNSSTATTTQLKSEPSISNDDRASLDVQTHATETGIRDSNLTPQASNIVIVSNVDSIQQHQQTEDGDGDNARLSRDELAASNLSGGPSATSTHDVPSSLPAENPALENEASDGLDAQSHKPSASGKSEPLGLGGGLIPKRKSRAAKPSDSTTDTDSSSVSQNKEYVSVAQQFLQGVASQNTNASRSTTTNSAPPSSTPQPTRVPLRRQGGEGEPDIGSMVSGILSNPVFSNLMSNVVTQAGGSRGDVRSAVEGLQSPAIVDTISNIVQNADEENLGPIFGSGRGQGGLDLSRMMQRMIPVVSQVFGGAGGRPTSANSGEPRSQPQRNGSGEGNNLDGRSSSQIDLRQARQVIERHGSPENIFSAVLETAAQANGEDDSIQGMVEELVSDPELTNGYLELLVEQVEQRIRSESQSGTSLEEL